MALQLYGIASATINIFRGQQSHFQFNPVNQDGVPISLPSGSTGTLVVTTSLSPDANSVIHTWTDLYEFAGLLEKDFDQADSRILPLGSFLFEITVDNGTDPIQVILQGQVNVYPTQQG
jgi:hypothetical protein